LTTIQKLLEKDLVKKMPIKLKTQLRKTQEIADVIIGMDKKSSEGGEAGGPEIRVLSDLASTVQ